MDSILSNCQRCGETPRAGYSLLAIVLFCSLAATAAGCTLDFDQFDTGAGTDVGPPSDTSDTDRDSAPADADANEVG
ncbi:MAG: hypothetical protein ABEN55_06640, partial [Bradymonadaceae bacterium]